MENFEEKLLSVLDWFAFIINDLQQKLRGEHLQQQKAFFMLFFPESFKKFKTKDGKSDPSRVPLKDLVDGYKAALMDGTEAERSSLAELLSTSWLVEHMELYTYFEERLQRINEDISQITSIGLPLSEEIAREASGRFGVTNAFLFVVLASVALHQTAIEDLRRRALEHKKTDELKLGLTGLLSSNPIAIRQRFSMSPSFKVSERPSRPGSASPRRPMMMLLSTSLSNMKVLDSPPSAVAPMSFGAAVPEPRPIALSPVHIPLRTSSSFSVARSDDDYKSIYKSTRMEGLLEKRSLKSKEHALWKPRWVVLEDAQLYYYKDKERAASERGRRGAEGVGGCVPLYIVRSIRTSPKHGKRVFALDAVSRVFHWRSEDESTTNQWLFCFQCALALKLEEMLRPDYKDRKELVLKTVVCKLERWWRKQRAFEAVHLAMAASRTASSSPFASSAPLSARHAHIELESQTSRPPALPLTAVVASSIGHRSSMEDAHRVVLDMNTTFGVSSFVPQAFFGVFDGHGGAEASAFAARHLVERLVACPQFRSDLQGAFRDAFLATDAAFIDWATARDVFSGTTAVCAVVRGSSVVVANCGDSRAVLCRGGRGIALSSDHKPLRADERARVEACGGVVVEHKELNLARLYRLSPELLDEMEIPQRLAAIVGFITIARVQGELSVTRAIGDREYKGELKREHWSNQALSGDLIVAEPELTVTPLLPTDEFLLLACDGLWDVFSDQEAVDFVRVSLESFGDPQKAAAELVNEALRMGSTDNVTVIVALFDACRPQPTALSLDDPLNAMSL